ncbi:hypothetical protein KR009_005791 [Drosophila setifemur]|nr:hypothetical protein KR009_005791 [Drosophila setifemur]
MSESNTRDSKTNNKNNKDKDNKEDNEKKEKEPNLAKNFLYMFEFVVDDVLITRQNMCAPEEYPTCTEISFRSMVYINICDREVGTCVNPCSPKCGKSCLFTLDGPITEKDKLMVHVYKKKTESCKFLIGLSELAVKPIFERVKESFDLENPNWEGAMMHHSDNLPKMKGPNSKGLLDNCACYERVNERHEQWCSTSELSKRLLPLFNLCKMQTGNMVLIVKLVCIGPSIVSSFPFSRVCSRNPKCPEPCPEPCCGPCNETATGGPMDKSKGCKGSSPPPEPRCCTMVDPCAKRDDKPPRCLRYFSCNLDKMCPCDCCEDEFDRECPPGPPRPSPIEKKLQKCGPCGSIPAYPRYIQEQKAKADQGYSDPNKDKKKCGKDGKDGKDGKGKKGKRQEGGAVYCIGNENGATAVYPDPCEPVFSSVLQPSTKTSFAEPCEVRHPELNHGCEEARKRAIRKLHQILVKYNIQIDN